ncbi:uncharacterized protein LOC131047515 isoform X1 [Cryptomeria japonica]|uniref:uncharacterized protein LOC131047515 isoform X1 n=2 Tax=Cryptomeria japonica TaxID=3369 RepID=UPI0025ABAFA3|nr:uncharacterized protein LOC131047515 isoform X1 [Cryptomeria japonica]
MASSSSLSSTEETKRKLLLKTKQLEVAIAELKSLHPSRPVYEKKCGLFFRTDVKSATTSQERELDKSRAQLQKMLEKSL